MEGESVGIGQQSFFGFDHKDVMEAIEQAALLPPVDASNLREEYQAMLCHST